MNKPTNIINAAREAWANHRGNTLVVCLILSLIYCLYIVMGKNITGFTKTGQQANNQAFVHQYLYTVVGRVESHKLLVCEAMFIAEDPEAKMGPIYGRVSIPYHTLGSTIPKIGDSFVLAPSKSGDGSFYARMAAPPPDELAKAPVAKVVKVATPTTTSAPAQKATPTRPTKARLERL